MQSRNSLFTLVISFLLVLILAQCTTSQTWTSSAGPAIPRNVKDIAVSSDGVTAYAADQTYLFKTTNGGTTWALTTQVMDSPTLLTCETDNPSYAVVVRTAAMFYTTDGGANWSPCQGTSGLPAALSLASSVANSSVMYLGLPHATGSPIYYSGNAGQSFSALSNFTYYTDVNDIAPYTNNADKVYIGGSDYQNRDELIDDFNRGMWFSTNRGTSWTAVNGTSGYDIKRMALKNESGYDILYFYTKSNKLFLSTNSGSQWNQKSLPSGVTSVSKITARPDNGNVYIVANNGVFCSTNQGTSWSSQSLVCNTIAHTSAYPATMYAVGNSAAYKTTDGGSTWIESDNGLGREPVTSLAVNESNIWTVTNTTSVASIYNGSSWSNVTVASKFTGQQIIRHVSGDILTAGTNDKKPVLFRSTNGGTSYTDLAVISNPVQNDNNVFKGCVNDPSSTNRLYVYGYYNNGSSVNNFYTSSNYTNSSFAGQLVGSAQGSYRINDVVVDPNNGNNIYFALENKGVYKSTTGGSGAATWLTTSSNVGTITSLAISSANSNIVYAAGTSGLWKSTNAGGEWFRMFTDNVSKVIMRLGYSGDANHIAITFANGSSPQYSNDGGGTWIPTSNSVPASVATLFCNAGSPSSIYAGADLGVYKIDAPSSVPSLNSPDDAATSVATNVTLGWGSSSGADYYHMIEDDNSDFSSPWFDLTQTSTSFANSYLTGGTWFYWKVAGGNIAGESSFPTSRSFHTVTAIALGVNPGAYSGGVYHAVVSWNSQGSSGPFTLQRAFGCTDGECWGDILVGTYATSYIDYLVTINPKPMPNTGVVVYYRIVDPATSNTASINTNMEEKASVGNYPKETKLYPNYPNPFNPTTTLTYDLNRDGFVSLKVYDVLGREVAVLVNGPESAGQKTVTFEASKLPSGVYFSRFEANGVSSLQKLLLTK